MLLALKVKCVISEALVSPNEIAKIMTQASHDPRVWQVMTPETHATGWENEPQNQCLHFKLT